MARLVLLCGLGLMKDRISVVPSDSFGDPTNGNREFVVTLQNHLFGQ